VLVLFTALLGLAVRREERTLGAVLRTFGWGGCTAPVAALLYWLWFEFVERHGGYAALLRHHRGYLGGILEWWTHWNQQLAQVFALSGAVPWRLTTWTAIVLTCSVGVHGRKLVAGPGWRSWLGLFLVLVPGGVVTSILPNLSGWLGLGRTPWPLCAERPSARLLGTWWIILSVLTPFYHPSARLWLSLHACGWLLLAGLLVRLPRFVAPPFIAPGQGTEEDPSAPNVGLSGRIGRCVALVCLALACWQELAYWPNLMPSDWVLDPEPTLRRIVHRDLTRDPRYRGTARILARRPLFFYLLLEGQSAFRLEPGCEPLASEPRRTEILLLDEAMIGQGTSETRMLDRLFPYWKAEREFSDQLDPVTMLEVKPSAALYNTWAPSRGNRLLLFTPKIPQRFPRSRQPQPTRTRMPP
jgi:dolichyl-phosphate-mannose-protein mannosyltransferase